MYEVKVFIIQKENGELLGAKLTREAAQSVARRHAPAKVTPLIADKQSAPDLSRALDAATTQACDRL
ncbi:hypothetical protein [Reyranella sp.]|uniref:hypothetical protein n=1 Tax=Reyranella sp. TaxID=1929291 RepID=UPI001214E7DE|nr:hypothetical protein [Reyranella sp.]TAJ84573.1 MAG: hypothetical protein EPO50_17950 [Reyranella sp.]